MSNNLEIESLYRDEWNKYFINLRIVTNPKLTGDIPNYICPPYQMTMVDIDFPTMGFYWVQINTYVEDFNYETEKDRAGWGVIHRWNYSNNTPECIYVAFDGITETFFNILKQRTV